MSERASLNLTGHAIKDPLTGEQIEPCNPSNFNLEDFLQNNNDVLAAWLDQQAAIKNYESRHVDHNKDDSTLHITH